MKRYARYCWAGLGLLAAQNALACDLNPDSEQKCSPALSAMYPLIISKWKTDGAEEDSIFNPRYWPETPKCLEEIPVSWECKSLRDVLVSATELPTAQATHRTFGVTLMACSGVSGASCHLYHRVYLIVQSTNEKGIEEYKLCSDLSCP